MPTPPAPPRRAVLATVLSLLAPTAWGQGPPRAAPGAAGAASGRTTGGARRTPAPVGPSFALHPAAEAFAAEVAERRQLPQGWMLKRLAQARRSDAVRRLIMPAPAGTPKNWRAYRDRFVEPERIAAGVAFWRMHERWVRQAEERFGVPAEIMLAIVGVETFYGRVMGGFRVIDALATLSFEFPSGRSDRSGFFRNELEEFFVWCAREGRDPLLPMGSYAGAMGLPQFMPSSLNRYAVDFDGDGRIDLHANAADVAGSVAAYLAEFGWQPGQPTHFALASPSSSPEELAPVRAKDILPSFTAAQLVERGVPLGDAARAHEGPLALIELENGTEAPPSYVAGTQNFYVITRYNWSSYYAMAVIELAQALRAARNVRS